VLNCANRHIIDVNVKIKYDKLNKSVGDRDAGCIWSKGLALLRQYNLSKCWANTNSGDIDER
jgi:hypothetical protein